MLLFLWHFGYRNLFGWDNNERWLVAARELFAQLADPNALHTRCVNGRSIYDIRGTEPEGFDVILMLGLIYGHGIDPPQAIASAYEGLNDGGVFVVNDHVHEVGLITDAIRDAGFDLQRRLEIRNPERIEANIYCCMKPSA
jgi:SAM-dependent methyltransferase